MPPVPPAVGRFLSTEEPHRSGLVSPSLVHAYLVGYQRRIARWAPKWLSLFTDLTANKESQWLQNFATHRVRLSSIVRIIGLCTDRQFRIAQTLKRMEELSFVKERIK